MTFRAGLRRVLLRSHRRWYLYGEASAKGIPSTMCEAGREGKIEEEFVEIHYSGIMNVMKLIGMILGTAVQKEKQTKLTSPVLVSDRRAGIFHPLVSIGDRVKLGQAIGEIWNFTGEEIEKITSPNRWDDRRSD